MKTRSSVRVLSKTLIPACVVFAILLGGVFLLARPAVAYAAIDPPCLGVQARILPDKDSLPFNEVLTISVTNGSGETVNQVTLTVTDHLRCGSFPWVIDLQTGAGPTTLAPEGSLFWWITGGQDGCPPGDNGPCAQWLHGSAQGTGASSGNLDTGEGDASLNVA